uniref:G-protein coupled receptors family 2 profile 2 domain-containing protein n=1 Tax=Neolamprologus brichardi TaxID=32507 RepID=A0A3Q4GQI4_NEOBR
MKLFMCKEQSFTYFLGSPWKTDGCETQSFNRSNEQDIACYCNHTTPFAVLLIRGQIAGVHWKILSYISYIGCGLSAFFTALSLLMYAFSRNHKLDYSLSIHVSLSGALFLLNSSFLLTEWGTTLDQEGVCVFVAAFMHFSLLCSFTWMAIEGLHLYLMLIKVFNTYYKHYLLKLSLAGWGEYCKIINGIYYMAKEERVYEETCTEPEMKQVLQTTLKTGATAKGKLWEVRERFNASCKSGLTLFGLTCLMGTTWGLAFLGSGYINYPILYLFCILNSTQGQFSGLCLCASDWSILCLISVSISTS